MPWIWPLHRRSAAKELIDSDVADKDLLNESFEDIARVNRHFGGIGPVLHAVAALRPLSLLDVGCGIADLGRAIVDDARRRSLITTVTCVDASADILNLARERSRRYPEMHFIEARGEVLPFETEQFDVATCTLTLHHCEPPEAIALLREMRRVARHSVVADLRRSLPGLAGAYTFSRLLSRNALTRHDAPMSIRRAYTPRELHGLATDAGWPSPTVRATPFFRMLLTDAM